MVLDLLGGLGVVLGYFALSASAALLLRRVASVPTEIFRKILHFILLWSAFGWLFAFPTWWLAALAVVGFTAATYPVLRFAERHPDYAHLLTERRPGEIKRSLVIVFGMFAALIVAFWGVLDARHLMLASVLAWGLGDAAAALVGTYAGRHALAGRLIEGRKSVEGTAAGLVASFVAVLGVLLVHGDPAWPAAAAIAAITAAVVALAELFTRGGYDTLTCPIAAALTLTPLVHAWGA